MRTTISKHSAGYFHLFTIPRIFVANRYDMTETTKSTGKYWVLFAVSTIIMILMLIWVNSWFWVMLPFVLTYLVQALDII